MRVRGGPGETDFDRFLSLSSEGDGDLSGPGVEGLNDQVSYGTSFSRSTWWRS